MRGDKCQVLCFRPFITNLPWRLSFCPPLHTAELAAVGKPGGDSHLEISVIPLCWDIFCIHVSTAMVPEPGKDLRLFCQCTGGHITANVKWHRREGMIGINCWAFRYSSFRRFFTFFKKTTYTHTARISSPLPLCVAKTGSNHLNEEFTPLLPTGIGERF